MYSLADGRRYDVDARNGRVWRAAYPPTESPRGAKGKISAQEAEEIARRYGTEHFRAFMGYTMKVGVQYRGNLYGVYFRQQAGRTGPLRPNWAYVSVNSKSGAVHMATVIDEDPLPAGVHKPPAVSEPQAIKKAAVAARMIGVTEVRRSRLRWARHCGDRLIWQVELDGVFPGEVRGARYVVLDAQMGEVFSVRQPETPDYRIVQGPDGAQQVVVWSHSGKIPGLFGGASPGGSLGGSAAYR